MNNLSASKQAFQQQIVRLPLIGHALLAILAFILVGFTNRILDASYAESRFPVPYAEGQTTFNGDLLKSYYQFMIAQGTLDIYWRTQFIDFGFIAAVFLAGLVVPLFLRRFAQPSTWAYAILSWSATLIPLGAIFDAIENLISFVMLIQPQTFPNWIVYPYSVMAVIKFASITVGMVALIIGTLFLAVSLFRKRPMAQ